MDGNDHAVELVITAPDPLWLRQFVGTLVRRRLCACGHLSQHETIYRWRGEVNEGPEAKAVIYTKASLVPRITELVGREHPYEVPHVSATPLTAGNPDYLRWILTETDTA